MKAAKQPASPEPGEVARRGKAAATEGVLSLIILELSSCFQPLSHPRYARLTAPLDNGSQGCVLALNVSVKLFFKYYWVESSCLG